jgi:hypothetical protein
MRLNLTDGSFWFNANAAGCKKLLGPTGPQMLRPTMCTRWCGRATETQQATTIGGQKQSCNEGTKRTQVRFGSVELGSGLQCHTSILILSSARNSKARAA